MNTTKLAVTADTLLQMQRGIISPALRYGDQSRTEQYSTYTAATSAAANFAGNISQLRAVQLATRDVAFAAQPILTNAEWLATQSRAKQIAYHSAVAQDVVEDMLLALYVVDNITDMTTIANAAQVAALADINIIRNPTAILALQQLQRIGPISSAFNALIKPFAALPAAAAIADNLAADANGILQAITSALGGLAGGAAQSVDIAKQLISTTGASIPGSFMMQQITGTRVPTTILANNPQMHPQSYTGQAFFGQSAIGRAVVDINQSFAKTIAVFNQMQNGAATPMFNYQNLGKFQQAVSLSTIINNIMFGVDSIAPASASFTAATSLATNVANLLNVASTAKLELRRADNSIPLMIAVASAIAETEKSPFASRIFIDGWSTATSVTNDLQVSNVDFIEGFRTFS